MKHFKLTLVSILFLSAFNVFSQESAIEGEVKSINWMSFEEALEASEKEPKLWFVDMYTDWCGWCKRMDATTFKDPFIVDAINDNYYAVKFDAEMKEDIVVGDSTYSFDTSLGRRGCHQLAVQLMQGKMSYPTYVFLNNDKQVLTAVPGYKVSKDMLPIIDFIAVYDPINNNDYNTFLQSYESPYQEETEE